MYAYVNDALTEHKHKHTEESLRLCLCRCCPHWRISFLMLTCMFMLMLLLQVRTGLKYRCSMCFCHEAALYTNKFWYGISPHRQVL